MFRCFNSRGASSGEEQTGFSMYVHRKIAARLARNEFVPTYPGYSDEEIISSSSESLAGLELLLGDSRALEAT